MDNRQMVETMQHAEDELLYLYWEIRDRYGYSKEAKKLDSILGKVYNLKCELADKGKKRGRTNG